MPDPARFVGRYPILGILGQGGMGTVYLSRHPELGYEVALKVLSAGQAAPEAIRRRFQREVTALAQLRHAGVVAILEAGEQDGMPWFAMRRVEGESLEERLRREGPLPPDEVRELGLQLCEALGAAHALGILHRDLKPDNVLATPDGRYVLTDFGLLKDISKADSVQLSQTGAIQGTPGYWAPEQAAGQGKAASVRTDVYGLGALLYGALTGQAPIRVGTLFEAVIAAVEQTPALPSTLVSAPAQLEDAIMACLRKSPEDRCASVDALAQALRGEGRLPPGARRTRWVRLGAALALALALALGAALGFVALLAPASTPIASTQDGAGGPPGSGSDAPPAGESLGFSGREFVAAGGPAIYSAWGARGTPDGLALRINAGAGPSLSLPFRYSGDRLDLEVRVRVEYLNPGAGLRVQIVRDEPGPPLLPSALARATVWVELRQEVRGEQQEDAWHVGWDPKASTSDESGLEIDSREHAQTGPFELECRLELGRGERPSRVRAGERSALLPIRLERGAYRLELVPTQRTPAATIVQEGARTLGVPQIARLTLLRLHLEARGGELLREPVRLALARLGELGRALAPGPSLEPSDLAELVRLTTAEEPEVYDSARFLRAWFAARADAPQAPVVFANTLLINAAKAEDGSRWRELDVGLLDAAEVECFAEGFVRAYGPRSTDATALQQEALGLHPLDLGRGVDRSRPPNVAVALFCLLRARSLGLRLNPSTFGVAWLFLGNPEEALKHLEEPAEQGSLEAQRYAGLAAYLRRDFARAWRHWQRLLNENPWAARHAEWEGFFARARRLSGRGSGR